MTHDSSPCTYLLASAGGRPRLAIPSGTRAQRCAAVRRFHPTSWKRRLFSYAVKLGVQTGLDRLLLRSVSPPLPDTQEFPLEPWLSHVRDAMDRPDLRAAVVWPSQPGRGRIYVHLLCAQGEPIAFAKLSFDSDNDLSLEQEAAALRWVSELDLRTIRTPRVLDLDSWAGRKYLMTEAIGEGAAPVDIGFQDFPQRWLREYAGEVHEITPSQLANLQWWRRFDQLAGETPNFAADAFAAVDEGVRVCRVHGDYGGNNILNDRGQLWLLDWEHCDARGPHRTDEIRLWIGLNQATVLSDPAAATNRFRNQFILSADRQSANDAIAAIAYLHARDIAGATLIARHWPDA